MVPNIRKTAKLEELPRDQIYSNQILRMSHPIRSYSACTPGMSPHKGRCAVFDTDKERRRRRVVHTCVLRRPGVPWTLRRRLAP